MKTERIRFVSQGLSCAAILTIPGGEQPPPVVVMGIGFGEIKEGGLPPFAQRSNDAGYATLMFDYRSFGQSEDEPRQRMIHDVMSGIIRPRSHGSAMNHHSPCAAQNPMRLSPWGPHASVTV